MAIVELCRSLGAQDLGGIGAQRAKDGGQGGNERSQQNGTCGRSDHIRVRGFDLVEKRLDIARHAESERHARRN